MKTYAYIYQGSVWEVIKPVEDADGNEIPLSDRYAPEFCESCVDISDLDPMPRAGWLYDGSKFTDPVASD